MDSTKSQAFLVASMLLVSFLPLSLSSTNATCPPFSKPKPHKPPKHHPKHPKTKPPLVGKPPPITMPPSIAVPPVASRSKPSQPPLPPPPLPPPPLKSPPASCPADSLKVGACVDLLGGLVPIGVGDSVANQCCPLLQGLVEMEAAVCLCTAIKLKLLDLNVYLPFALQLLLTCGAKAPPPGYTCTV